MCKVLIFGCITAVILMTAAYGTPVEMTTRSPTDKEVRLKALLCDLELLKDIDNNFLDFYTPTDKRECNQTIIACFLKELKVLKEDVEENNKQPITNIEKNLVEFQDPYFSNPTCKKCESNEKKKFPEFRQEMISFLQSMQKEAV